MKQHIQIFIVILLLMLALNGCIFKKVKQDRLVLKEVTYNELPGWKQDQFDGFVNALQQSCARVLKQDPDATLIEIDEQHTVQWKSYQAVCQSIKPSQDQEKIRSLIETWFKPYQITNNYNPEAFFTGYFVPKILARRQQTEQHRYPIYARPKDLVVVEDLGIFRPDKLFKNKRIAGKVSAGRLIPYHSRQQIEQGSLNNQQLELAWTEDLIGLFFMHIQGSGVVETDDGQQIFLGYDGTNGHPYVSIGKILIERNHIKREDISMQSIIKWLRSNPREAVQIMHQNPSYVFFRKLNDTHVLGSQTTKLVPMRSVAVDTAFIPLGLPMWINMPHPLQERRIQRLVVAQDTGGAIRGPARADLFCGMGHEASLLAGHLRAKGTSFILLPR